MTPLITVFTPTFNRIETLRRTYTSLQRQTSFNFKWLIVDDGSSDNTKSVVEGWIRQERKFAIEYLYKENGGMHTAHNLAYRSIDTTLNVCVDSDDMLEEHAIEVITSVWNEIKDVNCAGIIGLDADFNHNILGKPFDNERQLISLQQYYKSGGQGDKKLVYKTEIIKEFCEYPEFPEERLVPLGYKYEMVDRKYPLFAINEVLCLVEYQADGSTRNIKRQYKKSPKGFNVYRIERMKYPTGIKDLIKNTIHYISGCIYIGDKKIIRKSPRKIVTALLLPVGVVFHILLDKSIKSM